MSNSEHIHYNALNTITRTNHGLLSYLLRRYGSFETAWNTIPKEGLGGAVGDRARRRILKERDTCDPRNLWDQVVANNMSLVLYDEEGYPPLLREIEDFPWGIYVRGKLCPGSYPAFAVVGTRRATEYGKRASRFLVKGLAEFGDVVVVSGLALGLDASAHRAAVNSSVPTYAVLGTSLDKVYPSRNRRLAKDIVRSGGALISEYPPGTGPQKHHFPQRNRIVSGMSWGVVVIEAPEKSGSLITARLALDYNRDVYVVPGSIFSKKLAGSHALLQVGAKLVVSAEDIAVEYDLQKKRQKKEAPRSFDSVEREKIYTTMDKAEEPMFPDEIVRVTDFSASIVQRELSLLLLNGIIREINGKYYVE